MIRKTKLSQFIKFEGGTSETITGLLNDLDDIASELEKRAYRKGAVHTVVGIAIGAVGLRILSGTLSK